MRRDLVGQTAVLDVEERRDARRPSRCQNPGADVAKAINVVARLELGAELQHLIREKIDAAGWMDTQRQYHRGGLRALVNEFVASAYPHRLIGPL